ncbi:BTB/POZ-like [Lasallia pustulata]|uniref:BTB/POZ-like n=1 Tax=Lasallia pustulata TaxID=136370 RepID=A0A1W5CUL6_9LECA|nr:BTB/POZ-like [Lasallia pustulata]
MATDSNVSFGSLLTKEMVNVYVGPKGKCYYLHRGLLRSASDFFRCHFTKRQSSGADPEEDCTLADVNPASFELFITWLYQRTVATIPRHPLARDSAGRVLLDSDSEDDKQQLEDNNGSSGPYYALYFLSEKWYIPQLKNMVMDRIRDYNKATGAVCTASQIEAIYKHTPAKSPLRQYAVEQFLFLNSLQPADDPSLDFKECLKVKADSFLLDVFKAVRGKKRNSLPYIDPDNKSRCTFHDHEHDGGKKCSG